MNIEQEILSTFEAKTRDIVQEEADKAAEIVRARVRALAGSVATEVASWVEIDRCAPNLRITVKLPTKDSQP